MGYFLGIDGGGTKTHCVVLNARGNVIGEGYGGAANPLRIGYDRAIASLRRAAGAAMAEARIRPTGITAVCAGLAGAGRRSVVRRILVFLSQEFPLALGHVTTDYEVALEAAAGSGPGVVLIAGTGSVAYGRNAAGETARAGGYGPWLGDEGSAYEIGRRAVSAVARSRDGESPILLLAEMISAALECPDWDELMLRIMKNPDDVFPKLFPVVAEAANSEDSTAKEILSAAAIGLGQLAILVIRRLGMTDAAFPLAKVGGVFGRTEVLDSRLDSMLASSVPRADISRLEISPALGAARMAMRLSEAPPEWAISHET